MILWIWTFILSIPIYNLHCIYTHLSISVGSKGPSYIGLVHIYHWKYNSSSNDLDPAICCISSSVFYTIWWWYLPKNNMATRLWFYLMTVLVSRPREWNSARRGFADASTTTMESHMTTTSAACTVLLLKYYKNVTGILLDVIRWSSEYELYLFFSKELGVKVLLSGEEVSFCNQSYWAV